ncbi:MAG: sugar ABC transporter permease [Protaetiibacter sp.]
MIAALGAFVLVVALILFVAGRFGGRREGRNVGVLFVAPAVLGLAFAVIYPALRTIVGSTFDADGELFVGLQNYAKVFTDPDQLVVLRNTALWVILSPALATGIGLLYATLVERARFEALAKSLIFLPMAISFVGASIIWKFIYEYRPDQPGVQQIGLANQVVVWLGGEPQQWLISAPMNTLFLIVVMVWIQAGFAMTVLSAAIKGIPSEIVEAARMDGASGVRLFRYVTFPAIRPAFIVVLTTIALWTLKVFDIVRTMTGGQFQTNVLANEFYTQIFRVGDDGVGATLAVLLFLLVLPVVVYNVRQLRKVEGR